MQNTGLENFIAKVQQQWSGLNTETVMAVRQLLIELTRASPDEPWLKQILEQRPATRELYTDPAQGFILLAHTEEQGTYRIPHNHGAGWVFYAVQSGEMAMNTFKQVTNHQGHSYLVSRGTDVMKSGDCRVFLPGDIHDTRCLSDGFVQFRLTSSDFKDEIKARRMIRYAQLDR